jgi:transcriptional regulator with XRE-family HTH domain
VTFGEYLRHLREARGMTKNGFAASLGIPFTTVNGWERHGTTPNNKNLGRVVDLLKVSPVERKKLTELWIAIPSKRRAPPSADASTDPPAQKRPPELEALLTRALVPGRHTLSDGMAVMTALAEAAPLIGELALTECAARVWLDAAVAVRARGLRVTAALLAAMVGAACETARGEADVASCSSSVESSREIRRRTL